MNTSQLIEDLDRQFDTYKDTFEGKMTLIDKIQYDKIMDSLLLLQIYETVTSEELSVS
jgi:hypothetical protein